VNYSHRCPKGNRQMRRVLNQAANAAVKAKGTIFVVVYRRLVATRTRPSHRSNRPPAMSSDLEDPPRRHSYEERGGVSDEAKKVSARKSELVWRNAHWSTRLV
jgi:hypothetical protein